jgi:1,4-alpha-glucan branching enzyme
MMRKLLSAKPREFRIYAPGAKRVNLAGTFNSWNNKALSAKRDSKGNWMVKVSLRPGRYEYKFVVDGSWINDPHCTSFAQNPFGSQNCVLEIR